MLCWRRRDGHSLDRVRIRGYASIRKLMYDDGDEKEIWWLVLGKERER